MYFPLSIFPLSFIFIKKLSVCGVNGKLTRGQVCSRRRGSGVGTVIELDRGEGCLGHVYTIGQTMLGKN